MVCLLHPPECSHCPGCQPAGKPQARSELPPDQPLACPWPEGALLFSLLAAWKLHGSVEKDVVWAQTQLSLGWQSRACVQTPCAACFRIARELRIDFTRLNG